MATIKVTCPCGAEMETEGSIIHCGIEADRFLTAHKACREKEKQVEVREDDGYPD